MTTVTEKYLADITPRKLLIQPSCDQVLGSVVFRPCISTDKDERSTCAIITGCCAVTPLTNITPVSLWYQSYLNVIFHRTNLAFYGHATTMPLVVLFLMAYADSFRFNNTDEWAKWINANFILCVSFFLWYTLWGACYSIWWMGPCSLPILSVCYFGGHYYNERATSSFHPMILSGICAFIQSATHLLEDLPPRVSGSLAWTKKSDFACRDVNHCIEIVCRAFRLAITLGFSGPIDEWIASPRLLPLFWSLWPVKTLIKWTGCSCCGAKELFEEKFALFAEALGESHRVEVSLDEHSKPVAAPLDPHLNSCGSCMDKLVRCMCCEPQADPPLRIANPALDYVGTGGGTYMVVDDSVGCCDALCGNFTADQIRLDAEAGMRQNWRLCETDPTVPIIGVSDTLPGAAAAAAGGVAAEAPQAVAVQSAEPDANAGGGAVAADDPGKPHQD